MLTLREEILNLLESPELLEYLLVNISLLVLVAAILTELAPLRQLLKKQDKSLGEQLCLGVIFGMLSISGTYTSLGLQGALVNTRVVSTLAAGLVGGPIPGLCAGLLGGVHRFFYDPASFTSLACGVGTFCFGVVGAIAYGRMPQERAGIWLWSCLSFCPSCFNPS